MHFLNDTGHGGGIYLHQLPILTALEILPNGCMSWQYALTGDRPECLSM